MPIGMFHWCLSWFMDIIVLYYIMFCILAVTERGCHRKLLSAIHKELSCPRLMREEQGIQSEWIPSLISVSKSGSKYYYLGISEQIKSQTWNHHDIAPLFCIVPISYIHLRSLTMSTDKAACCVHFEGAWKVIKQELLDYITGKGMPKDAIDWYERWVSFMWKQNRAHCYDRISTTMSPETSWTVACLLSTQPRSSKALRWQTMSI